jgi:hypothetical protein
VVGFFDTYRQLYPVAGNKAAKLTADSADCNREGQLIA